MRKSGATTASKTALPFCFCCLPPSAKKTPEIHPSSSSPRKLPYTSCSVPCFSRPTRRKKKTSGAASTSSWPPPPLEHLYTPETACSAEGPKPWKPRLACALLVGGGHWGQGRIRYYLRGQTRQSFDLGAVSQDSTRQTQMVIREKRYTRHVLNFNVIGARSSELPVEGERFFRKRGSTTKK